MISPFLGQIDTMGLTAVIATILSVIFAAGAFYNSMHRRRHQHEADQAEKKEEEPKMRFRPPTRSTLPTSADEQPAAISSETDSAPVKVALAASPKRAAGEAESLFRQVRPYGTQNGLISEDTDEDGYVWE